MNTYAIHVRRLLIIDGTKLDQIEREVNSPKKDREVKRK